MTIKTPTEKATIIRDFFNSIDSGFKIKIASQIQCSYQATYEPETLEFICKSTDCDIEDDDIEDLAEEILLGKREGHAVFRDLAPVKTPILWLYKKLEEEVDRITVCVDCIMSSLHNGPKDIKHTESSYIEFYSKYHDEELVKSLPGTTIREKLAWLYRYEEQLMSTWKGLLDPRSEYLVFK